MEAAAAKAYLALFQASHKATPYSKSILRANSDYLADRVSSGSFPAKSVQGGQQERLDCSPCFLLQLCCGMGW
jgi:hypothetical protein